MFVTVENLKPGMVLEQDIATKDGTILAASGTIFTDELIGRLPMFNVSGVSVKSTPEGDKTFVEFNNSYVQAMNRVKTTFESVRYKQTVNVSEFEGIVDSLFVKSTSSLYTLSYMKLIEQKDEYTFQHSIDVCVTAMLMGKWMGYSKDDIKLLGTAAILHDIGKVLIPSHILNKPARLTSMEFEVMKSHTKLGYQLLNNSGNVDKNVKNVALTHHERIDGKGYPYGLSGQGISEMARVVAICDVYDAVTSKRVYREKENPLKGLKIIFENSYSGLDPYLCKLFLNNATIAYHGSNALLSDGNIAKIIRVFPEKPEKPWVVINQQFYDLEQYKDIKIIDVME